MSAERSVLILYATRTGTAQDVAERLARQCRRLHFTCRVLSTDKYSLSDLISETLVLFVISTTGSGLMWKTLLRSDLPSDLFDELSFAVFGLGDSAYEKFCWAAKKLSRRLVSLGATEICERGEGDDQDPLGMDGALESWMERIQQSLLLLYPLQPDVEVIPATTIPPARVSMVPDIASTSSSSVKSGFYTSTVRCNTRITAGDWYQDVRHLEFDFEEDIQYSPGDVAVIRPCALSSDVESFLTSVGWLDVADVPFRIKQTMKDQSLPDMHDVETPRALFTQYLDFSAVPRRSFFEYLRYFTADELEREKLDDFLSREGADDLYETIREVLAEFRHVKIPLDYIFDVFPPMRPRQFSIASSVKRFPSQVHLCVAIVKYRTKLKVPRRGVCTTFLAALQPGDRVEIGLQGGLIKLPSDNNTPVICIGPGTGVAPMRAVIQDRLQRGARDNTLYFGCRSATKDQHYGPEWGACRDLVYRAAFSRDGPEGTKRIYVQDLMQEDCRADMDPAHRRCHSSNKMPAAVKNALRFAAETYGKLAPAAAEDFISGMEAKGQLIEECWS
ncbi:riboflavin synthase domain-like protein [Mycena filopes]|nr:riboflavin synthase domain-like protein [Mycena filopes]